MSQFDALLLAADMEACSSRPPLSSSPRKMPSISFLGQLFCVLSLFPITHLN